MPLVCFTLQEPGAFSFRVGGVRGAPALPFRHSAIEHKKKASLRVLLEAVRIALMETQREANAYAFSPASAVHLETSHIPSNDCVAAQIDFLLRAMRYGGQGGGALPAYIPFTVSSRFLSFQFTG